MTARGAQPDRRSGEHHAEPLDEAQLTEGYARAHQLEREALRLERHCDDLLAHGGAPAEISTTLAERRAVDLELTALRHQLAQHRRTA